MGRSAASRLGGQENKSEVEVYMRSTRLREKGAERSAERFESFSFVPGSLVVDSPLRLDADLAPLFIILLWELYDEPMNR